MGAGSGSPELTGKDRVPPDLADRQGDRGGLLRGQAV